MFTDQKMSHVPSSGVSINVSKFDKEMTTVSNTSIYVTRDVGKVSEGMTTFADVEPTASAASARMGASAIWMISLCCYLI